MALTPDRWAIVERLYHAALERPDQDRAAFVAAACAGNEELRREVESLLRQDEHSTSLLDERGVLPNIQVGSQPRPAKVAGRRIDNYEIIAPIGSGGMGDVYRARDTKLGRDVAIKMLSAEWLHEPERRARFDREARLLAALNHPCIGAIYGVEDATDGTRALILELVEGPTLADRLKHGRLPVQETLSIGVQIAEALDAAHQRGIVHRDLKPANIKITVDGRVKVLDFGIAKLSAGTGETPTDLTSAPTVTVGGTREGLVLGTAAYMSPEQARGASVDQRTDIWALGCVLFEMLTGRRAFPGDTLSDTIAAVLERDPNWGLLPPLTSRRLCRLLKHCLAKNPAERLGAIREAKRELALAQGSRTSRLLAKRSVALPLTVLLLGTGVVGALALRRNANVRWATDVALPEISRLMERDDVMTAFNLARQADRYIPSNGTLSDLKRLVSESVSVDTDPQGAEVSYRSYGAADTVAWTRLGRTPLRDVSLPKSLLHWKLEKSGFVTVEDTAGGLLELSSYTLSYSLDATGTNPTGMVRVTWPLPFSIFISGLLHLPPVELGPFWMDRYEVTNRAFKRFVDDGGYAKREFWKQPFERDGRPLRWEDAIALFRDTTGRPGPANWELGAYPAGQDDYPVTGVSWYEAAAYAEYAGKALPTLYHWSVVATPHFSASVVPRSNFSGRGPLAVGASHGMNRYGAYDMAGNVKEWSANPAGAGKRYILGGAWNEPPYMFINADARSPFDRDPTFGFRCIKLGPEPLPSTVSAAIELPSRDYRKERPVSNEVFNAYRSLYSYDKRALRVSSESVDDREDNWRKEKVSFDAAYGNERVSAYLFLPKRGTPPYQTVVYFPGNDVIRTRSSDRIDPVGARFDWILKSGRAVIYPVYKGTFERGDELQSDVPNTTSFWRDHVIMWAKDLGRTIDYLESRPEIDRTKIAFMGLSWGAQMGAILPAVETRMKAVVLIGGGFNLQKTLPEVESINFAPHVNTPTLMLNGKYDFAYPLETSQEPMFRFLGPPSDQKRRVVYDTGHLPPRNETIKETLDWLDVYLGPVR